MKIRVRLTDRNANIWENDVSDSPLLNDGELKRLIWEEWEGEIKEEDPREMVFKYMKIMRDEFIKHNE